MDPIRGWNSRVVSNLNFLFVFTDAPQVEKTITTTVTFDRNKQSVHCK